MKHAPETYSWPALPAGERALSPQDRFESLTAHFLRAQDIGKLTRENYRVALQSFFRWYVAREDTRQGERAPTREDVLRFKDHLKASVSALTVSTYLSALRRFFDWAGSDIAKGVKGAKKAKGFRKDPLTPEQTNELLRHMAEDSTLEGLRDYALVNLLVRTGLRRIEAQRADVGDIRQEGGEAVLWIQGKGHDVKDEYAVLTGETLKPINEYLKARGGAKEGDPLFTSLSRRNRNQRLTRKSITRIVKRRLREINLDSDRLTAHSLRHTAITLCLQAGATVQEARALARHANINTTMIYAHNIDRIAQAPERKIDAFLAATA